MEETYIQVGERISQLRKSLEISQQKLAEMVGYETSTAISLIESGKRRVQLVELEQFAKVLHTSSQYLLTGKEPQVDIAVALRAENDLKPEEIQKVVSFIDFIKSERNNEQHGK
jgi:transcriptional regulator with XRE-family HTH domain